MAIANIETKQGLKISIEGNPSDIAEIIEDLQNRERRREERMEMFKRMRERDKERREKRNSSVHGHQSVTGILKKTIEEGFFNKPRIFREIVSYLEKQGVKIPASTLHPLLSRLVTMDKLKRNRRDDNLWEYVKK